MLIGDLGVVSLDGFRSRKLLSFYREFLKMPKDGAFVVIGHPKALCRQSIVALEQMAVAYPDRFAVL